MVSRVQRARRILHKAVVAASAVALVATTTVVLAPSQASAAGGGTTLLEDSFMNGSVTSTKYKIGGSGFTPCLTASGTANANVPGQCSGASDTPGTGALRLTNAVGNQAGFLLYDHALPTKAGLDIEFQFYQYGGDGADGISFFLTKGTTSLTQPGGPGGSLGYHFNNSTPGLKDALLGVGFDAFGNFGYSNNSSECAIRPPFNPDSVAVRGPASADQLHGYCLLGTPVDYSDGIDNTGTSVRSAALRKARVVIDPPTDASPRVKVYVASGSGGDVSDTATPLVNVAQPVEFASNPTFKFGWSAGTGGSYNVHEINFLKIASVDPLPPELLVTANNIGQKDVGQPGSVVVRPKVANEGGPEKNDIVVDLTTPAETQITSTPTGTGWSCVPNAGDYRCTYDVNPSDQLISGTELPVITVPVATATTNGTGSFSALTATVDSSDNYYTTSPRNTPQSATSSGSWHPIIGSSAGSGTASISPSTITLSTPTVTGTPISGYVISTAAPAGRGTASIDSSGVPSFTPAAGTSGTTTFKYRAVGANSTQSMTEGTGTVTVKPVASGRSASTTAGSPVALPNSVTPVGTGPFTYTVTQPASGGTATINATTGAINFTPSAGHSGPVTFSYVATDSYGIASDPATVTLNVAPVVSNTTLELTLNSDGDASGTSSAPTVSGGSGVTFSKTADPSAGVASVNSTTGAVTYTAANGASGIYTVGLKASDGGVDSAAATSTITVQPYLSTVSGASTTASDDVTLAAPTAIGSGPLTYTVGTPTKGSASINPSTGAITYDPQGHSGEVAVTYTVRDVDGVTTTRTANITVAPVVAALSATVATSEVPFASNLNATPVGDGPWTYEIVSGLDSSRGTAVATASGVRITPESGVSGTLAVTYRVKGSDDVWSAPATATLTVTPVVVDRVLDLTLNSDGEAGGSVAIPTPAGTGAFTFVRVTNTSKGSATVNAATGVISYSVTDGSSGTFTATYAADDADGVTSNTGTVTVTVHPYIANVSADAQADTPITITPPESVGTPPSGGSTLTYSIGTAPTKGAASINPATGVITYDPQGHSGTVTFTYTATGLDGVATTRTVTVTVRPVTDALSGSSVASDSPLPIDLSATPVGDGPWTYEIVSGLDLARGTALATATGVRATPGDGVSGTLQITYRVKGADDIWSAPKSATVTVSPVAADGTRTVPSGSSTPVVLPSPIATGPAIFQLVSGLPTGWGTATVATGTNRLTLDVPNTKSGNTQVTYKVIDPDTLESATATLDVVVTPVAHDLDLGSVAAAGVSPTPVLKTPRTPYGSGPFTYEIVSAPSAALGTVVIDATTGAMTVTPKAGASGRLIFTYRVVDASSLNSNTATATLTIVPSMGGAGTGGTGGNGTGGARSGSGGGVTKPTTQGTKPLTIKAITPIGTGPFTYRIVNAPDPSVGTLVIDPTTGEMTFVAAEGFKGTASFSYEVVDANGLVSDPQSVEVVVLGDASANPPADRPRSLAFTGANVVWTVLIGASLVLFGVTGVRVSRGLGKLD